MSIIGNILRPFDRSPVVITDKDFKTPFKISLDRDCFIKIKTENLFIKILHRCYSRSEGAIDPIKIASLFDSKEKSGASEGLISLIAIAMAHKQEQAIIFNSGIARIADFKEKEKIKKDYEDNGRSTDGVLINFENYKLTELIKSYYSMIYDALNSMNTQLGLAKALQIKINSLRATVSMAGKDEPVQQAKEINEALTNGKSVLLDKNDSVETLTINSESVEKAIFLVNCLIASEIGTSLSFVNGELTTGMSATGEADSNADEYGFQDFFNSIFKPICDKLYDWNLRFVSDDWRYFSAMIGNLIIVENSALLSEEQKKAFADRLMPIAKKIAKK
jgi:hypothetical protein